MKFHLPGLPTMSALMLSSVLSAWLGIAGPVNLSVIKEWQTSIGFLVALFVGWIAWVNVNRTLKQQRASTRITLVGREEDRIERELPNMRDLELFVGMLALRLEKLDTHDYAKLRDELKKEGFTSIGEKESADEIAAALPTLDLKSRQRVRRIIRGLFASTELVRRAQMAIADDAGENQTENKKRLDQATAHVKRFIKQLREIEKEQIKLITIYNERLPKLRAEIEAYFAD